MNYTIHFHNPMYGDNPSAWRVIGGEFSDFESARLRAIAELKGKRDTMSCQIREAKSFKLVETITAKEVVA